MSFIKESIGRTTVEINGVDVTAALALIPEEN
jgi:hypothetical protein